MSTLADVDPIVALIDRGQGQVHRTCAAGLNGIAGPLITTWPCFTETMYFRGNLKGWQGQNALWQFRERNTLRLHNPSDAKVQRTMLLMERYSDTPMDFADASLVPAAETLRLTADLYTRQRLSGLPHRAARLRLKWSIGGAVHRRMGLKSALGPANAANSAGRRSLRCCYHLVQATLGHAIITTTGRYLFTYPKDPPSASFRCSLR